MNFLKEKRKYINSWAVTRRNSDFGEPGDVILIYNDEDGKRMRKAIPFGKDRWYFYIKNEKRALKKLKDLYNLPDRWKIGKDWIRIYFPNIQYRQPQLRNFVNSLEAAGVETYEADLGPSKRLCLDYDLKIEDWDKIRILYFDIETDDTADEINIGGSPILSFGAVDGDGKEFFLSDPNERILLEKVETFIRKYDMLVGWNSKGFDLPYLKERFKIHKISTEYLSNVLHEDMMKRVQYFYSKDPEARQKISSYSLDSISNYFLGETKIERKEKIIELYRDNFEKFKRYNLQDCKLLKKLEDELGTIKLTYMMFQWCGVFAQNWSMVKTIDNFILSDANKKGIHYRTNLAQMNNNPAWKEDSFEFLGAYVLEPDPGYYEDVYDLDFKSLYPNIIRTFNVGPDAITEEENYIITPKIESSKGTMHGGMKYSKQTGIISEKIGILLKEREQIRKKMKNHRKNSSEWKNLNVKQLIVKELSNSIYGVLGNKWFRSFSIPLAESITATGQYLIKFVKKINEEAGRKVIYGDTDSVFLILKDEEEIENVLKWINKEIEKDLKENYGVIKSEIEMGLDIKFDQFLIEAKKKYVGKTGDSYKFVGMECVKRDTIPVAVNYQKKLIDRIMKKQKVPTLKKWIEEKKKTILFEKFNTEDLTIRKKLSKAIELYKGKSDRTYTPPIHVRIAADLKNRNKKVGKDDKSDIFTPGSIIEYVIIKGGYGTKLEGVHISEFRGDWDRLYYWNNIVYPLLERILKTAHPEVEWEKYYLKKQAKALKKLTK